MDRPFVSWQNLCHIFSNLLDHLNSIVASTKLKKVTEENIDFLLLVVYQQPLQNISILKSYLHRTFYERPLYRLLLNVERKSLMVRTMTVCGISDAVGFEVQSSRMHLVRNENTGNLID